MDRNPSAEWRLWSIILATAATLGMLAGPAAAQARRITFSPSDAIVQQPVTFRAENFPNNQIRWDFDDGTPLICQSTIITHTYSRTGTFLVKAKSWCGDDAVTTTVSVTVRSGEAKGPLAPFKISFIQLRFQDGKSYQTVARNAKLKALADIKYEGTGVLQGRWVVDGNSFKQFSQSLAYARSAVIDSGDVQGLPTLEPGLHEVTLQITSPAVDLFLPKIRYLVTGLEAGQATLPLQPLPLHLSGVVRFQDSKAPICRAMVEYRKVDRETKKQASAGLAVTTDTSGRFFVAGVAPNSPYVLRVYGKGLKVTSAEGVVLEKSVDDLVVEISPEARRLRLAGLVRSVDSQRPVPGLTVEYCRYDPDSRRTDETGKQAVTDAAGRFALAGVEPFSSFKLIVSAGEHKFTDVVSGIFNTDIENFIIEVEPLPKRVLGRLVDSLTGQPIANATVFLMKAQALPTSGLPGAGFDSPLYLDKTSQEGSFIFNKLGEGSYTLHMDHWKYPSGGIKALKLEPAENGLDLGTVKVKPRTGSVRVKVVPEAGAFQYDGGEKVVLNTIPVPRLKPLYEKELSPSGECVLENVIISPPPKPQSYSVSYEAGLKGSAYYVSVPHGNGFKVKENEESFVEMKVRLNVPHVAGRVIDNKLGISVGGANVQWLQWHDKDRVFLGEVWSDSQGVFVIVPTMGYEPSFSQPNFNVLPCEASGYENIDDFRADISQEGENKTNELVMTPLPTYSIQGIVVDEEGEALPGVTVQAYKSGQAPETDATGRFEITDEQGDTELYFSKRDYNNATVPIFLDRVGGEFKWFLKNEAGQIEQLDPHTFKTKLTRQKGSVEITVQDEARKAVRGAHIALAGEGSDETKKSTDDKGIVRFNGLITGRWQADITGPADENYVAQQTQLNVKSGQTTSLVITLRLGAEVSGKVVWIFGGQSRGVRSARVSVPEAKIMRDSQEEGRFSIKGIPPCSSCTLEVIKPGCRRKTLTLSDLKPGTKIENVTVELELNPLKKIYGFEWVCYKAVETNDGSLVIDGALTDLPSRSALEIASTISVPFKGLQVKAEGQGDFSLPDSLETAAQGIEAGSFKFPGTFQGLEGRNLKVAWKDKSRGSGEIKGVLLFPHNSKIAGHGAGHWTDDESQPLSILSAEGGANEDVLTLKPLKKAGSGKRTLWGYELSIDQGRLDSSGLHYQGSLRVPDYPDLPFAELLFDKEYRVREAKIAPAQPAKVETSAFSLNLASFSLSDTGLMADGAIILKGKAEGRFDFKRLLVTASGEFGGTDLRIDRGQKFSFIKRDFTISSADLDTMSGVRYIRFSGALQFPEFDRPVKIEELTVTEKSRCSARLVSGERYLFRKGAETQLYDIKIEERSMALSGKLDFKIPLMPPYDTAFHFTPEECLVDTISLGFDIGFGKVQGDIAFDEKGFRGDVKISVPAVLTARADFSYSSSVDWAFKLKVDAPIAVGPVMITEVRGGLKYDGSRWQLDIGGDAAAVAEIAKNILSLGLDLTVRSGPVISGKADLTMFNSIEVAEARVTVDDKSLSGSAHMGFDRFGFRFNEKLSFNVQKGSFYAGGGVSATFLGALKQEAKFYIGYNFSFPDQAGSHFQGYPRKDEKISGLVFRAQQKAGVDLGPLEFQMNEYAYGRATYSGSLNVSGGFGFKGRGQGEVSFYGFGVGLGGSVEGYGSMTFHDGFSFDFNGSGEIKGYVGCCDMEGCDGLDCCWWGPFPCGVKVCFSLGLRIGYGGGGISFKPKWPDWF